MTTWTPELDATLREALAGKATAQQAAVEISRRHPGVELSRMAVIGRARRIGAKIMSGRTFGGSRFGPRYRARVHPALVPVGQERKTGRHHVKMLSLEAHRKPSPIVEKPREAQPATDRGVRLVDLRPDDCRWPLGDPATPEFRFCGGAKDKAGGSYCSFHRRVSIGRAA